MKMFQTKTVSQNRPVKTKVLPAPEAPAGLLDPLALRLALTQFCRSHPRRVEC